MARGGADTRAEGSELAQARAQTGKDTEHGWASSARDRHVAHLADFIITRITLSQHNHCSEQSTSTLYNHSSLGRNASNRIDQRLSIASSNNYSKITPTTTTPTTTTRSQTRSPFRAHLLACSHREILERLTISSCRYARANDLSCARPLRVRSLVTCKTDDQMKVSIRATNEAAKGRRGRVRSA